MASQIATLSIDLEVRLAKMSTDLGRAVRLNEQAAATIQRNFDAVKASAAGIGTALAGAFAGVQVINGVRNIINQLDGLNDIADATGTTIEKASALEDIAIRTGTSVETMTSSLVKLNQELNAATPGSETERVLKAIGLDAEQLRQIDPADALMQVSKALNGFADNGTRARTVQLLFGKSTKEVAAFLKDMADKGELVGTVTTQQAKEAEKFNQQLMALGKNLTDAGRAATSDFLPAINGLFDRINAQGGLGATMLANAGFDEFAVKRKELERLNADVARAGDRLNDLTEASKKDPFNPAYVTGVQAMRTQLEDLMRKAAAASAELKGMADVRLPTINSLLTSEAGAGRGGSNDPRRLDLQLPSVSIPAKPGPAARASVAQADPVAAYIKQLEAARISVLDLSEEEKLRFAMLDSGLAKATPAQRDYMLLLARGLDAAKAPPDLVGPTIDPAQLDRRERLNKLLDATPAAQLQKSREEMQFLAAAMQSGEITAEEFSAAASAALGIVPQVAEEAESATSEFLKQAQRNIQSTLSGTIKSVLTGDFSDIGAAFSNLLIDMATQAAAAKLGEVLFGSGSGGAGSSGGGSVGLFQMGLLALGLPGFASGGSHLGGLRIVGEKGPELEATGPSRIWDAQTTSRMLNQAGGGSSGAAGSAGGTTVIHQKFAFSTGVDQAQMVAFGNRIKNETLATVQRSRTRAGSFE